MRHSVLWCCCSLLSCLEVKQMFAAGFSGSKPSSAISHTHTKKKHVKKNNRRQIVLAKSPLPQTSLAVMNSHLCAWEVLQCQSRRGNRKCLWLPENSNQNSRQWFLSQCYRDANAAFNCQRLKAHTHKHIWCVLKGCRASLLWCWQACDSDSWWIMSAGTFKPYDPSRRLLG